MTQRLTISLPDAHADALRWYAKDLHAGNVSRAVARLIETAAGVTKSAATSPKEATS